MARSGTTPIGALNPKFFKNYLINGNFDFWQRGESGTTSSVYTADRWNWGKGGTATWARLTGGANGSTYAFNLNHNAATDASSLFQALESENVKPLQNKKVTFSVWLRKSSLFDHSAVIRVQKGTTANTLGGGTWTTIANLTISAASISTTQWTRFSVTGDMDASAGLRVAIYVNGDGTGTGARDLYLSQIMLNEGDFAAPFSLFAGTYESELAACQRYYEKSWGVGGSQFTAAGLGGIRGTSGVARAGYYMNIDFYVEKRGVPTIYIYDDQGNGGTGAAQRFILNGVRNNNPSPNGAQWVGTSGFTFFSAANAQEFLAHYAADAEL